MWKVGPCFTASFVYILGGRRWPKMCKRAPQRGVWGGMCWFLFLQKLLCQRVDQAQFIARGEALRQIKYLIQRARNGCLGHCQPPLRNDRVQIAIRLLYLS